MILNGYVGRIISQIRFECDLVDRLIRGRGELVVWSFFGKFLSRFSTGGSKRLWMINLLKNEPLRTTTSVTKLLCDSWWNTRRGFARSCADCCQHGTMSKRLRRKQAYGTRCTSVPCNHPSADTGDCPILRLKNACDSDSLLSVN